MPPAKRPQREVTGDWEQLRLYVASPQQEAYELLRPIVLFGRTPAERARETGVPERTLRRKADRFDATGIASLFETRYPSPQPFLAPLAAVPWHPASRLAQYCARARRPAGPVQASLFPREDEQRDEA